MGEVLTRFQDKFIPESISGCWVWTAAVNNHGYGKMWDGERIEMAHRLSYRLHVGEIPKGAVVCHRCDNPACVNPDHMFLGTMKDNSRDCVRKGRNFVPREENSNVTAETVAEIRALPADTTASDARRLAAHYGLSDGGFYKIRKGLRWGHL